MGALFYIINQRALYRGYRKDYYDENVLELLSRILIEVPKSSSLEALKSGLKLRWEQPYDIIIPYGDIRHTRFETIWKFDLDKDQLIFNKDGGNNGCLALSVLRQRPFTFDDFETCESPTAPNCDPFTAFSRPYWQPVLYVPQRKVAFTRQVLEDFNFQWRHILRYRYNDLTFRKIVQAILHIATFNFGVKELTEPRQGLGGALVGPLDLPEWDPLETRIVLVGRVWCVASHNPAEGLPLVREHLQEHGDTQQATSSKRYLIMSVRHLILCRLNQGKLEWTRPIPFLNGIDPVLEQAVEILLAATSNYTLKTPIHLFPIELQTRILRYMSQGPVNAARVGCILELGLPFAWKDGQMDVRLETVHKNRHFGTPVESQVWFGDHFSGVAYRGDVTSIPGTQ
ncbi:hypothetical protein BGZ60DRAFT_486172 [Tricladium varicosporioides]|nr:hypothetical protein BGZ60DRAFT_486172 [Hymenoscyphus varicosporioides]